MWLFVQKYLNYVPSGLRRAMIEKVARWAATVVATAVATWLYAMLQKYGLPVDGTLGDWVKEIAGAASAIIIGGGALLYSILDAKKVDVKMQVAATAGYVAGVNDGTTTDQGVAKALEVADAATPKNKDELVAAIKTGNF